MRKHAELIFIAVVLVLVCGGSLLLVHHITTTCEARGGKVQWTGGGYGHLCVAPDGRIIP